MSADAVPDGWDPDRYHRFRAERSRPFHDLLQLVEAQLEEDGPTGLRDALERVLDPGCGTGELTRVLHERLAARRTFGLDRSAAMLGEARAGEAGPTFLRGAIERLPFAPGVTFELVFSNAALHWIDDHPALVATLLERVSPGGLLAVQVPANHEHVSHRVAFELAGEEPFRTVLGGYRRVAPVLSEVAYAELLARLGCEAIRVRTEVYLHELDGPEAVVEWMRGTTPTAYEQRLDAPSFAAFVEAYRERLLARLEPPPPGRPFPFPFRRTLFCARRRAQG